MWFKSILDCANISPFGEIDQTTDYQSIWSGKDSQPQPVTSVVNSTTTEDDLKELTDSFIQLFQDVIKDFEQCPNGLDILKQVLASLLLPQKFSGKCQLLQPQLYSEAKTIREIIMQILPFINPVSFHLLQLLAQLSGCIPAIEKVSDFIQLRLTKNSVLLCNDQFTIPTTHDGLNDLNTLALSDAMMAHTASLDVLQSAYPQMLARLPSLASMDVVRVSAMMSVKRVTFSNYDCIVTAICGFFLLPKSALVYVGYTNQPLVLCWCVAKEINLYMRQVKININCELLLAEQGIANIMIGDWLNYKCLTIKVCTNEMVIYRHGF